MTVSSITLRRLAVLGLLAGCKGTPTMPPPPPPPPPGVSCGSVTPVQLSVGQHQVIDPAQTSGCVRVPQAGASGAEYLVAVVSGSGIRSQVGVQGSYLLRAVNPGASAAAEFTGQLVSPLGQPGPGSAGDQFDSMLRERERQLSSDPRYRSGPSSAPSAPAAVPQVGDQQTFKVCSNLDCNLFVEVPATARFVGTHAAIFMDNTVPQADTLRDVDYQELGNAFDDPDHGHYQLDVAAFGDESDIDSNQRVIILMTDQVNDLTSDCTTGRILGYFFGGDLLTTFANSNKAEVFYTFVPKPATSQCSAATRRIVIDNVKPTLIHELQHMISFNQHALIRGGQSEETWLNEALSHFAEELGGRLIPASECPGFSSCRSQYVSGDIINTHDYLKDTEATFLVAPTGSNGSLAERGAGWYFLRWVVDHFATDTILGSDFTPTLVKTPLLGASNLTTAAAETFPTMVTEWMLASYLDDLAGFTGTSARMRFKSWGLRSIWTDPRNAQIFPQGFPLKPDSTSGSHNRNGTLRGGSGRHLRLIQAPSGSGIDVQVTKNGQGEALSAELVARIGIVRIR